MGPHSSFLIRPGKELEHSMVMCISTNTFFQQNDERRPCQKHGVICDCRIHALILIADGLTVQTAG